MLSMAFPAELAGPVVDLIAAYAPVLIGPVLGVAALAVFLRVFKPLLIGVARAALLVVKPRRSLKMAA